MSVEVYVINLVIAIPVFFIMKWIYGKIIRDKKIQKPLTWVSTIIATPLVYIGIIMLWITLATYYPTYDFDKERWKNDKERRYELSEDLIESKILIGKTKDEVIELLGDEGNNINADHWAYYLGFVPRMFSIDPDVLDIRFKDGKVVKVEQHET